MPRAVRAQYSGSPSPCWDTAAMQLILHGMGTIQHRARSRLTPCLLPHRSILLWKACVGLTHLKKLKNSIANGMFQYFISKSINQSIKGYFCFPVSHRFSESHFTLRPAHVSFGNREALLNKVFPAPQQRQL